MKTEVSLHPDEAVADAWVRYRRNHGWTLKTKIGEQGEIQVNDRTEKPPTAPYYKEASDLWIVVMSK